MALEIRSTPLVYWVGMWACTEHWHEWCRGESPFIRPSGERAHPQGKSRQGPSVAVTNLSAWCMTALLWPDTRLAGIWLPHLSSVSHSCKAGTENLGQGSSDVPVPPRPCPGQGEVPPAHVCLHLPSPGPVPRAPLTPFLVCLVESLNFSKWRLYAAFPFSIESFNSHCLQRKMHTLPSKPIDVLAT